MILNSGYGTLTASGGMVYLSASNKLLAFQGSNGAMGWSFSKAGSSEALVVNGVISIGSEDGSVYALNASDGAPRWHAPVGGPITALVISQEGAGAAAA